MHGECLVFGVQAPEMLNVWECISTDILVDENSGCDDLNLNPHSVYHINTWEFLGRVFIYKCIEISRYTTIE